MFMQNQEKNNHLTTVINDDLYDLSLLEEMDDTEYLLDILGSLLKETPVDIKEMKEALSSGKTDIVCQKAHKLKSSAGAIQANQLVSALEAIEAACKKGTTGTELAQFVDTAYTLYNDIEIALKEHVKELGGSC